MRQAAFGRTPQLCSPAPLRLSCGAEAPRESGYMKDGGRYGGLSKPRARPAVAREASCAAPEYGVLADAWAATALEEQCPMNAQQQRSSGWDASFAVAG